MLISRKPCKIEHFQQNFLLAGLRGKSFGFVSIDIECKNISISGDIGGFILSTKLYEFEKPKTFYFSVSRTANRKQNESKQSNAVFIKNTLKTSKMCDKSVQFLQIFPLFPILTV